MRTVITLKPIPEAELRAMRRAAHRQAVLASPRLRANRIPSGKVYNRRKSGLDN
jgi:hypothetical protein